MMKLNEDKKLKKTKSVRPYNFKLPTEEIHLIFEFFRNTIKIFMMLIQKSGIQQL